MNFAATQTKQNADLSADARNFGVQDRVVLVTGSGQGIGRELARQFAAAGAKLVVADLNLDKAGAVADEIGTAGGEALSLSVDVSSREAVEKMVASTIERYGRIDVLINNASIFSALIKRPFDEIPTEEWQSVMNINVNGVFYCASAVAKPMKERGFGRIINISSASVHRGTKNYLHYVTSKSALIGMTNSMARELGPHGVTVNCIRPGTVATEVPARVASLTPEVLQRNIDLQCIPRTLVPSDLVGLSMFLSTPASGFITGQTIACDGGYTHSF
ncbi:glucose 1-dehydrogenase [Aureimonas sp. Leaf324]|uniref:SDR family NAD(P)-dependent oxidoreductase n=1 Tax=Aureimonas sp. Leaf324 TaxID=1736336 RepID=UPI0006FB15DD|nr:glucose 1-dehydrogenase [Aureimonas sp. Leaf324]KQQ85632.1 short-chain dehydrogenase [Aureimonas sp. Leaf324]